METSEIKKINNSIRLLVVLISLIISKSAKATTYFQDNFLESTEYQEFQGKVIDEENKKPLALATILVEDSNISTITNSEGNFIIKVPRTSINKTIIISFLGYKTKHVLLTELKDKKNLITLKSLVTELAEIDINVISDATNLVKEVFNKIKDNYLVNPTIMTAFYRETIKKRRKNVSLSEAIINIYKSPYDSAENDHVELFKSRKSTDYSRLDTLAMKLQGGPFNTLLIDIMKYPEYIFSEDGVNDYNFTYNYPTIINNKRISVISFKQKENIKAPLYEGNLYIDAKNKVLISADYALNITNKELASKIFIRKKPGRANVWPKKINYKVDYREKNGKWYYGYSSAYLEFKVNWSNKLFNSNYSMVAEMAITDWKTNAQKDKLKQKQKLKPSVILTDKIAGFYDTKFWGKHNIIEPEKSIEVAIKKIKRQLDKSK